MSGYILNFQNDFLLDKFIAEHGGILSKSSGVCGCCKNSVPVIQTVFVSTAEFNALPKPIREPLAFIPLIDYVKDFGVSQITNAWR